MIFQSTCKWLGLTGAGLGLLLCLPVFEGGVTAAENEISAQTELADIDGADRDSDLGSADCAELEYMDRLKAYVLLPEDYSTDGMYPSVYFMPQDGYSCEQYLKDGTCDKIRELEQEEEIPGMIYVFPQLSEDVDLEEQIAAVVEAVESEFSAADDASMRGVIGTGAGGYLAFLTGYSMYDGAPSEDPEYFCAVAGMDGDYTSSRNPWIGKYGDLCSILRETADSSYGGDTGWVSSYYTYLDANADNERTWEESSTGDIASVYRADSLVDHRSPSAWDYSVFEYSILSDSHYGEWLDHLERPLSGFARKFNMVGDSASFGETEDTRETEDKQDTGDTPESEDTPESGDTPESEDTPKSENTQDIQDTQETEDTQKSEDTLDTQGNHVKDAADQADDRILDLMGDWYFRVATELPDAESVAEANSIAFIMDTDWDKWDAVQPGLGWWTEDFADCLNGNANYMGYAWYVREFEVPEGFDLTNLQIDAGMIDEADEVYLNGVRIGQNGIPKEGGSYDGSNPWEEERIYLIPDGLLQTGSNVIAVRICNGNGGGGWYSGPIQIEPAVDQNADPEDTKERFYKETFESKSLNGMESEYRVYLPEGYYESDLRYPVVYMLHGYGSTGRSFEIAGVPEVLDEGIASGEIPPCIVIFPTDGHPQKASWWTGPYAKMLCDDLVAQVDETLRTVDSREYRFLAGESMGGGGAYLNALTHKDLFGGVFDIYGDLTDTGVLPMILDMDAEELGKFRHYIICGNHDMYAFDLDHIVLGGYLNQLNVPHVFEIDNGEHSSSFYLKYIKEGFGYLLEGLEPVDGGTDQTESET